MKIVQRRVDKTLKNCTFTETRLTLSAVFFAFIHFKRAEHQCCPLGCDFHHSSYTPNGYTLMVNMAQIYKSRT